MIFLSRHDQQSACLASFRIKKECPSAWRQIFFGGGETVWNPAIPADRRLIREMECKSLSHRHAQIVSGFRRQSPS
jgi:hypothetical protein